MINDNIVIIDYVCFYAYNSYNKINILWNFQVSTIIRRLHQRIIKKKINFIVKQVGTGFG